MKETNKGKKQYNIEKENENIINDLVSEIMHHSIDTKFLMDFSQKIREYRNKVYELKVNLGDNITEAYKEKNDTILESLKKELENYIHMLHGSASIIDFMSSKEQIENVCRKAINWKKYPIYVIYDDIMGDKEEKVYIDNDSYLDDNEWWYAKTAIAFGHVVVKGMTQKFLEGIYPLNVDGNRELNMEKLIEYTSGNRVFLEKGYEGNIDEVNKIEKTAIENVNISKAAQVFQYYEKQIAFWQEMNLKKIREESTKEHYFE